MIIEDVVFAMMKCVALIPTTGIVVTKLRFRNCVIVHDVFSIHSMGSPNEFLRNHEIAFIEFKASMKYYVSHTALEPSVAL